jgi:hypothetical protein
VRYSSKAVLSYVIGAVGGKGVPTLRSWEIAVTSCAGANGFCRRTLPGTPCTGQSAPAAPVM